MQSLNRKYRIITFLWSLALIGIAVYFGVKFWDLYNQPIEELFKIK